ncbi:MAG TPA: hypothetical protein H9881_18585 [Candidatus Stackebrandtia excrementipullorum]|nr:hypothetical protein [Candidatus Stackebrandtia excrementipullorum]
MSLNTTTRQGNSLDSQALMDLAAWYHVLQCQVERINERVTRLENQAAGGRNA